MTTFAIWDIDNCLADDTHRLPLIDLTACDNEERFAKYNAAMGGDEPCHVDLFNAVAMVATPVFFTSRPQTFHAETVAWLQRHYRVCANRIYMRAAGDKRDTVALKHHMLVRLRREFAYSNCTIVAYDDREDVCDMYQAEGVDSMRIAIHDSNIYVSCPLGCNHFSINHLGA